MEDMWTGDDRLHHTDQGMVSYMNHWRSGSNASPDTHPHKAYPSKSAVIFHLLLYFFPHLL